MDTVKRFICDFLTERGAMLDEEEMATTDFVEAGLIDSFETLNLFMSLDEEFGVRASPTDMASPRLHTVDGLASFVRERSS